MSDTYDCPKCGHEHEPNGSHDDDAGKQTCDNCGFEFIVEIEYDPSYYTRCVVHEYGEPEVQKQPDGTELGFRKCVHCGQCDLTEVSGDE